MTTFYGIATTETGKNIVIDNLPTDRLGAESESKRIAAKQGLAFQYVLPAKTHEKKGSTLTKYARARKQNKR
ncbi:hypothetical protein SAMN04487895_101534 [Paenibacillus sophorae]|uniref:Uncharacterized protein n=1 Tax=Paenibacillus sophorae TaxID=1333845 RepID=A0A1H8GJI9_9BACL|nr:hypothetical protein [Paenibacillus sophorae]QWU14243.1 hypothetical protein KP014_20245 [Paenibacillus sophorae]SEN43969.1 hypothetical protein SAMN04487895_101534 [Paenibacillus sophorae]